MLNGKGRVSTIIVMVLALLIGTASLSLAATAQWCPGPGGGGTGTGWGCGQGWTGGTGIGWCNGMWGGNYNQRGTQFMAHGKIVAIDTAASSITVTMDGASPNLLTKLGFTRADLPTDVTFQMKSTVKVWGCGWHNKQWGSGTVTLASLKAGDIVNLMGYFDKTSGDPIVSRINVWFY
ncbi:MAG TPA: hypothetical protein PLM79_00685 [Syntrophobacteraceae bacterium]|nr:hypothetical protein [Syntrophobacteraceae bacterium]